MSTAVPIVFDLDGTLVDSLVGLLGPTNRLLARHGLRAITLAEIRPMVGDGALTLLTRAMAAAGGGPPSAEDLEAWLVEYETVAVADPFPGAQEALAALLERGHPLGICTNKPIAPTRRMLENLGWTGIFSVVVGGDSLAERKPHPAPLLHVVQALGGGPALFIGDSEVDAETAHRAGIPLIIMTHGYARGPRDALGAAALLDGLAQLPDAVQALSGPR